MKQVKGIKTLIRNTGPKPNTFRRKLQLSSKVIAANTNNGLDEAFAKLNETATGLKWKDWSYVFIGLSGPIYAKRTK